METGRGALGAGSKAQERAAQEKPPVRKGDQGILLAALYFKKLVKFLISLQNLLTIFVSIFIRVTSLWFSSFVFFFKNLVLVSV